MRWILVERIGDRRHVRWGTAFILAMALGLFAATVSVGTYFWLSRGVISPVAAIIGFIGPFISIGVGIRTALTLPLERLPTGERQGG